MPLCPKARAFIAIMTVLAAGCFALGAAHWQSNDSLHFLCYVAVATMASALKITLPGIDGTMSVNFLFVLLAVMEMSLGETLVLGSIAVLVQCFWRPTKRPQLAHIIFNISQLTVAAAAAYGVYHIISVDGSLRQRQPLALIAAAITYFLFNTIAMSLVISLTERKRVQNVWQECYFWSFPYYLVGGGIAEVVGVLDRTIGWQAALLVMPPVYIIYRSYKLYLGKLETEKKHVEQMAALHLRTIEALALAIEAKDYITHHHLQRVRVYASEVANDLGVSEEQKEALRAAALLHDIGKLAVPEHIISKPGKLTEEEFEKMKIHPIIGAEILEQVEFPYPVVPIVRSHHEKWDGSGYPDGLKGEEIPIGARILSAVDCLDALASDRQYRLALPLEEAMARVAEEAGKAFDPNVVAVLQRRYVELEKMATEQSQEKKARLSKNIKVKRGAAPAAGFASGGADKSSGEQSFVSSIAAARQEGQTIFELTHELGKSLNLNETLSILSTRLKRMVPYDCIAIHLVHDGALLPEFVNGEDARVFISARVPLGVGLSGWVAQNRKVVLNGNPGLEPGSEGTATRATRLRSALAVPLEGSSGTLGVLALYSTISDAFTPDHLRILLAITSKLGVVIENTIKYRVAETSASSDSLTGLLNSRSLFMQLDKESSRCRRDGTTLTVFVCDFDQFKKFNDRFGHVEGNRLLQAFAQELKKACRQYDCIARMGGDEFVIVAPDLSPQASNEIMDRIAASAVNAGRLVCKEDSVSVSVGCAFYPTDGQNTEELLTEADRRMYQVKEEHHNKLKQQQEHTQVRGAHA